MQSVNLCKEVLENAIGVHETCEKSGMEMQPLDVVAVQAMKELLQYREIGEVSTCRNAVEICRAMIERGIEPDNIAEYIKFEDNLVQRGYDLKRLLEMMEEHKQYREIGTPEECRAAIEKQVAMKKHCDEEGCLNCPYQNPLLKENKCMKDFVADGSNET